MIEKRKKFFSKGFTVVEALVYSFILLIVLFFIVRTVITVNRTHRQVKLTQQIESSGTLAMERILREARNASSITIAQSVLGSNPGTLKLAGTDEGGTAYTMTFDLSGGQVRIAKDSEPAGALTETGVTVTSLVFRRLSNPRSEAVRVEMTLQGSAGSINKTLELQGSAVLRDSYK